MNKEWVRKRSGPGKVHRIRRYGVCLNGERSIQCIKKAPFRRFTFHDNDGLYKYVFFVIRLKNPVIKMVGGDCQKSTPVVLKKISYSF